MTARITVRTDARMDSDLAVLHAAGWSTAEAVRMALSVLADAQETAILAGVVPVGTRVEVTACTVQAPPVEDAPAA